MGRADEKIFFRRVGGPQTSAAVIIRAEAGRCESLRKNSWRKRRREWRAPLEVHRPSGCHTLPPSAKEIEDAW